MSVTTQQPAIQLPAVQAKTEIEYTPFGGEDRIKLSLVIIQKYIAVPTRDKELPDERDCMKFMMLCRARRLNPFEGDAFLIGFRKRDADKAEWSLITSISAFYKRAELHPEYSGIRSGVIVRDNADNIVEREGDFTFEDDKILGGWATVHFRSRSIPMTRKVKLSTYQKPFGVWVTDPGGMICKVAECQALRDSFPTMCGGMYLREEAALQGEILDAPTREAKRPDFGRGMASVEIGSVPAKPSPRRIVDASKPVEGVNTAPEASKSHSDAPSNVETGKVTPSDDAALAEMGLAPAQTDQTPENNLPQALKEAIAETEAASATPENSAPVEQTYPPDPRLAPKAGDSDGLASVKLLASKSGVTASQIQAWAIASKLAKAGQSLSDLSESKLIQIGSKWSLLLPKIREQAR